MPINTEVVRARNRADATQIIREELHDLQVNCRDWQISESEKGWMFVINVQPHHNTDAITNKLVSLGLLAYKTLCAGEVTGVTCHIIRK